MSETREFVNFQIEDGIAVVVVDRPPVNALNRQVEDEIEDVFEELGSLNEIGAVIIRGGGEKAFMAGAGIQMLSEKGAKEAYEMSESTKRVFSKIERFERVVIAAVDGLALGGGCEVALACDIRVADESALFGFPEVSLGLLPGAGGTQRLTRLVGSGKAKELILTGDPVSADEAKRIGLIERVAPKGEAVSEAKRLAQRVLLRGPIAIVNAKKAINEGLHMTPEDGFKRESQLFSALFETRDMREGVNAFLEKRKPNFLGE
jgi:enoyl-CoA hydratase/carnithine racemase